MTIPFYKMSGSGNDFIIIDNREDVLPMDNASEFAAKVCQRKLSVGADGLILIEPSDRADFRWRFYNSDGSLAEMCGNGARCTARFAMLNGITAETMAFETIAGRIHAQVKDEQVKIKMTDPFDLQLDGSIDVNQTRYAFDSINTGVPHVVMEVDNIEMVDVVGIGRQIRHHDKFAPAGSNVNFVGLDGDHWAIRTYERGVEDETLACGTGVVAGALILASRKQAPSPIALKTRSGSIQKVFYTKAGDDFREIYLEGDAQIIYQGQLNPDAWR